LNGGWEEGGYDVETYRLSGRSRDRNMEFG
jgi:hypothetical protein